LDLLQLFVGFLGLTVVAELLAAAAVLMQQLQVLDQSVIDEAAMYASLELHIVEDRQELVKGNRLI
jgi:hypothetical protein